jgi:diguanylate cyclase (GGDEF)-like protein/PAS domain S-box-containing protein
MTTLTGDRADRAASWAHPVVLVLATGPVVLALGIAVAWTGAEGGLAAWWPAAAPAALAVAVAASGASLRRPSARPLVLVGVLLAIGLGSLLARLLAGRYPSLAAGWALADVAHAAVAGLVLASGTGLCLRTLRDVTRLAAAAVGGAVVAAAIAVLVGVTALREPPLTIFFEVAASRASALLLLAPLAMRLPPRSGPQARGVDALLWVLVLAAVALVLAPWSEPALMFVPAAALVVAALLQSPRATTVQTVVVGVVLAGAAAGGVGPLGGPGTGPDAVVQTFLAVVAVTVLLVMIVVAARDSALRDLDETRRFDSAVLEGVSAGVLATDADGRIVLRNAAYREAAGPRADDGPATARPAEQDLMRRALGGEDLQGIHVRSGAAEDPRDLVADARQLRAPDGELLGAVATFADVTDERVVQGRLREAITFHDAVLAASPDVIFITDVATHRVVWASGTVEPTLGYTPSQVVELDRASRLNLVHPDDLDALHDTDDAASRLRDGEVRTVRVRMSNDRGDLRWMSRRVTPFTRDADGRVVQLLGVARDVTDVVEVEQRLTDAANRDPLTGLLNRRALLDRLGVLVARASDAEAPPTPVLFCDLDGFKAVNDSLGHAAGDQLLTTVAHRIVASLRDGDTPARAGGDEFVLLLEPLSTRQGGRADVLSRARTVARRILDAVSRPVEVQGTQLAVTISIGIALVRPGIGPGEVLRDADAAMYRAKSTGKNRLHVFEVAPERRRPGRS